MSGLTDDDVLRILEIVDREHVAAFELTMGDLHIAVGRPGGAVSPGAGSGEAGAPAPPPPAEAPPTPPQATAAGDGAVEVRAPLLGIFYTAPEPGADPFVEPGSTVSPDTTVGLIEIMKMFNTVTAGVDGVVLEVCAENGALVELGQPLLRVRPGAA